MFRQSDQFDHVMRATLEESDIAHGHGHGHGRTRKRQQQFWKPTAQEGAPVKVRQGATTHTHV